MDPIWIGSYPLVIVLVNAMAPDKAATLNKTSDPIQYTVDFQDEDKLNWRKILMFRCYEDLGSLDHLLVSWTDYNSRMGIVKISNEHHSHLLSKIQNKTLFKTIIRITTGNSKLMTITLFYTTCTLLIQGHASRSWVVAEYQRFLACINHIHTQSNSKLEPIFSNSYPVSLASTNPTIPATDETTQLCQTPLITMPPDSQSNESLHSPQSEVSINSVSESDLDSTAHTSINEATNSSQGNPLNTDLQLIEQLQQELQSCNATIQSLTSKNSDLTTRLQAKETECSNLQMQNNELQKALSEKQVTARVSKSALTTSRPTSVKSTSTPKSTPSSKTSSIKREKTIILGDSHARFLAEKMKDTIGIVNPKRGIEHLDTSVVKHHEKIVLIAGSNNISSKDSINEIDKKFSNIIENIKSVNPTCNIFIQSILPRHDMVRSKKITIVNQLLKSTCDLHKVNLMPTPLLNREDFTQHGLHLNDTGKSKFAKAISDYIDDYNSFPSLPAPSFL